MNNTQLKIIDHFPELPYNISGPNQLLLIDTCFQENIKKVKIETRVFIDSLRIKGYNIQIVIEYDINNRESLIFNKCYRDIIDVENYPLKIRNYISFLDPLLNNMKVKRNDYHSLIYDEIGIATFCFYNNKYYNEDFKPK